MKQVIKQGHIHTLLKSVFKSGGAFGYPEIIFTDCWIERNGKTIFRTGGNIDLATKEFNRLNDNYIKRKGQKSTKRTF